MKKINFIGFLSLVISVNSIFCAEPFIATPKKMDNAASMGDISGIDANIRFKDELNVEGDRPIHSAARNLKIKAIEHLVSKGVSIDSTNGLGITALHLVASLGSGEDVQALLELHPKVNLQDRILQSAAIHYAVFNQNIDALIPLLSTSNIDLQNKFGQTALHLAVIKVNLPIVKLLLQAGINRDLPDYDNKTALMSAQENIAVKGMQAIINELNPVPQVAYNPNFIQMPFTPQFQPYNIAQMQFPQYQQPVNASQFQQLLGDYLGSQNNMLQPVVMPLAVANPTVEQAEPQPVAISLEPVISVPQQEPVLQKQPIVQQEPVAASAPSPKAIAVTVDKVQSKKTVNQNAGLARLIQEITQVQPPAASHASIASNIDAEQKEKAVIVQSETKEPEVQKKEVQKAASSSIPEDKNKEQVSKHKLKKQKEADLKARVLLAKKQKAKQEAEQKRQLKAANSSSNLSDASQESFENVDNPEEFVQVEAEEESQEPAKEKKDLSLHKAISKNKSIEEITALITPQRVVITNEKGDCPLHIAAERKNTSVCIALMTAGAIVDALNDLKLTALHFAVATENFELVDYLLSCGSNPNILPAKTNKKIVALANQCKKDQFLNLRKFRTLPEETALQTLAIVAESSSAAAASSSVQEKPQEINESLDYTLFIAAVLEGNALLITDYLNFNPEWLYVETMENVSPLYKAILGDSERQDKNFTSTKLLIERDHKIIVARNKQDNSTPFHFAINLGNVGICIYLLSKINKIADLDLEDFLKDSIVYCQQQIAKDSDNTNFKTILKLLQNSLSNLKTIKQDAQATSSSISNSKTNQYLGCDKAALSNILHILAQQYGMSPTPANRQEMKNLIEAGADVTTLNGAQATYLHLFASLGDEEMVTLLLSKGLKPEIVDISGNLALHDAVLGGFFKLVVILIKANKETRSATNEEGDTPLHLACACGHVKIIELLISLKIDTQAKNKDGLTPFLMAVNNDQREAMQILLDWTLMKAKRTHADILKDLQDVLSADRENKYPDFVANYNVIEKMLRQHDKLNLAASVASSPACSSQSVENNSEFAAQLIANFFKAISKGKLKDISRLLKCSPTLIYTKYKTMLPLHAAIISQAEPHLKIKMIRLFAKYATQDSQTNISFVNTNEKTPLQLAVDTQLENECFMALLEKIMESDLPKAQILYELRLYCNDLRTNTQDEQKKLYCNSVIALINEHSKSLNQGQMPSFEQIMDETVKGLDQLSSEELKRLEEDIPADFGEGCIVQ
ncbi:MAG: ankyrin repeat domain-containing protein [Candidatus Babeliales bacterium]|nr:ankyrin repeat domain-containing protein [Candidatus Babeliales bacterium]